LLTARSRTAFKAKGKVWMVQTMIFLLAGNASAIGPTRRQFDFCHW